jgi:hypothetical protein
VQRGFLVSGCNLISVGVSCDCGGIDLLIIDSNAMLVWRKYKFMPRVCVDRGVNEVDGGDEDVAAVNVKKRKLKGDKTSGSRSKKQKLDSSPNLLDATWIHPESYSLAER